MTAAPRVRLAVAGAGLIGKRHMQEIAASPVAELCGIVDPSPAAAAMASEYGVPLYTSLTELLSAGKPEGIILATPNKLHVPGALECIAAGIPVLVEKPLSDDVESARVLVREAEKAGVPVLTGHHRNYSPIMARAREVVRSGRLGRIVAVTGSALFYKPDAYFDENGGWRRSPGGGPILINLTHDLNALLTLLGPIVSVQATTSNATRNFGVEDTAAVILRFASGALGTFLVSDTAASARSWEQTSGENKDYARYPDECYHVAGTRGSLDVPTLRVRVFEGEGSWYTPFVEEEVGRGAEGEGETKGEADPLAAQIAHFADVIRGAAPICSARDGLRTMLVVEAVQEAARTGATVFIDGEGDGGDGGVRS